MELEGDDLREYFRADVFGLMSAWREKRIDTRGVASGTEGCQIQKVAWWILTRGSRPKFDRVLRELGPRYTVEARLLDPRYSEIAAGFPEAVAKANARLLGQTEQ